MHHKTGFPDIIFSYPTRGIYFLIRVHNYTKIKGLDSGKITSLPNSENVINLHALFQSSPKINRMLITRLICIQWKSSRFLSPVSTVSARNALRRGQLIGAHQKRKHKTKRRIFRVSLALLKQARLISVQLLSNILEVCPRYSRKF